MNTNDVLNKLVAEIKRYENTAIDAYNPLGEDADFWHGKVAACEDLKTLITSLQQEQPDLPSGEDVMIMCNQILIDWVKEGKTPEEVKSREEAYSRFFELYDEYLMREQSEVDLEKEIETLSYIR